MSDISSRTFGFVSLSTVIHIGTAVAVTYLATEFLTSPKALPVTEIEIISSPAAPPQMAGASSNATVAGGEVNPVPTTPTNPAEQTPMPEETPAPVHNVSAKEAPKPLALPKPQSHASTPVRHAVQAPNFETAQLDEAPSVVAPSFDEGMIDDDLAAVAKEDKQHTDAQVKALRAQAEKDQEQVSKEHAVAMAKIAEESVKMKRQAQQQKAKEQLALQKQIDAEAESKSEAEARLAAVGAAGKTDQVGETDGIQGAGGVRGIQDLKQMPGNRRPDYDSEDRYQGRQGQVVFMAYVTKDGRLKDFEMIQSSGHRNLDFKTLKALKEWKFYPGQEGLVEIPFQWDLKGGPQEMPTGLRTKVSQGQRPSDLKSDLRSDLKNLTN